MSRFAGASSGAQNGPDCGARLGHVRRRLAAAFLWLKGREGLLIVGLFVLALAPRLFRIASVPPGLNGDEVFNVIDAWRIGHEGFPLYLPGNNGREVLFFYLLAASLGLLGSTVLALRLPAVLLGAGSVIGAYLLGRDAFNRRSGLLAASLISVSLWPVMISRLGLRAISLTFFTTLTLYLAVSAMGRQSRRWWLLAGLALGLTMYTYIPSRLFPAVILVWMGWVWFWRRRQWRANRRNVLLSLLLAGLVFAPFGIYMAANPDQVNQRIYSMENALDRARSGEPQALLSSTLGVVKMFSIDGDEEWRYHLSGDPVFDPLTGLFFYLGLALTAWRAFRRDVECRRQPEYALLLAWMAAMLVPNAVLNENPSFLRAAGAIVPIYLVAATGLDAVLQWLGRRHRAWRMAGPALVGLGVIVTLGVTVDEYFGTWASHPQVRAVYNAEQAAMGRYLAQNGPAPETRVFVASGYVYDNTTAVALSFYTDQAVTWFDRQQTFAWPAAGQPAWYLIPDNARLPDSALDELAEAAPPERIRYEDGDVAFTLYRLTEGALAMAPSQKAPLTFEQGLQLTGFDAPQTLTGGEQVTVTLHWQIPQGVGDLPNALTFARVDLIDAGGQRRARAEALLGYPQASWQEGDRFLQQLLLEVPQGMVPGPASLEFGLRGDEGAEIALAQESPVPRLLVRNQPLVNFTPSPEMTVFDETLALREAVFRPYLTPGADLNVTLDWVALRRPQQDYRVQLQLAGPGEEAPFLSETFQMLPDLYPPKEWRRLEQVTTLHGLEVPLDVPLDPAPELRVRLLPEADRGEEPVPITQGSASLGTLTPDDRQRVFEAPDLAHTVSARFGDAIRLLGYEVDASQARPGGEVKLTLAWQASQRPEDNYVVFNHLLGSDGQLWGQLDSAPVGEAWLTRTWLPGEVVVEERTIPIEPQAPQGPMQLVVGMYTVPDIERLAVTVDGEERPSDQLLLTEIDVH